MSNTQSPTFHILNVSNQAKNPRTFIPIWFFAYTQSQEEKNQKSINLSRRTKKEKNEITD